MSEDTEELSLRETLENAAKEHDPAPVAEKVKEAAPVVEAEQAEDKPKAETNRDEKGKFKAKEEVTAPVVDVPAVEPRKAPIAWSKERQAKFNSLPPDVQDAIIERESEVEKGFTKLDEDRNFGKSLKEVITPYMATIQAEGGTPQGAVKDLLNTAYVLRTGSPQQKAAIVQQVIKQYGIDPNLVANQQPQQMQAAPQFDPAEIERNIMNKLQTQQMNDKVANELAAFTADPKNVHFSNPTVKDYMSSLLGAGKAKDYQDAYDQAIWLVPEIRPALIAAQTQPQQAQPTQDMAAKKKAGSSVSGSPGITVPNSGNPNRSLRDELEANLNAALH
jgi:hypothetical protein